MAEPMEAGGRGPDTVRARRGEPFIEILGVTKVLGGRKVLDELTLRILRGETIAILGASGSGKSVLLRHIVGLMRPDEGRILVDGIDVTNFSDREFLEVRRKVSYVFQGGALFDSMTVGENVAFGLLEQRRLTGPQVRAKVSGALELVDLRGIEDTLPAALSGGMRKRVALARSMALEPACLLYDEPTAGLDPVTGFLVIDLIRKSAGQTPVTSVVVTHDLPAAYFVADRIAFLHEGKMAFVGTVSEARASAHPALHRFLNAYDVGTSVGVRETRPGGTRPGEEKA